jgi:hypothetical protein
MPTADAVREKALNLAEAGMPVEEAVQELLEWCEGRRIPVVLAHQRFSADLEARPSDPALSRAAELLELVLGRLPQE